MLRLALIALPIAWVALILASPSSVFGVSISGAVYALGSLICHQRPERSFHVGAAQLPVCARCVGLYAGAAAGALAALAVRWPPISVWRVLVAVAAIPTALTWGLEVIGAASFSNAIRFAAALPLGAAVALTVNYAECRQRPQIGSRHSRTPI